MVHDAEDPALHVSGPVPSAVAPLAQHAPEPVEVVDDQIGKQAPEPVEVVDEQIGKQAPRKIPRLPQSAMPTLTKTVCRDFNSANGCKRKRGCNYLHENLSESVTHVTRYCRFFKTVRGCSKGAACDHRHDVQPQKKELPPKD